jgi:hypothetical protein
MTTTMSRPEQTESRAPDTRGVLRMPELWGAVAIASMWIAVLFCGVYGGDFLSTNGGASQTTTIPSAVFVALFAFLASVSVARHAFSRPDGQRR